LDTDSDLNFSNEFFVAMFVGSCRIRIRMKTNADPKN
jgi:hypothetical protein